MEERIKERRTNPKNFLEEQIKLETDFFRFANVTLLPGTRQE